MKWSEEKIIEYIREFGGGTSILATGCEMLQQLRDERRWIPASERLPEKGKEYLVIFQQRIAILPFYHQWYWGDESAMGSETQKDITHWMPLPLPSKED